MSTPSRRTVLIFFLAVLTAMQSLIPMTAFADVRMRCAGMAANQSCAHVVRAVDDGMRSGTMRVPCACCKTMGANCAMAHRQARLARMQSDGARITARSCAVTVTVFSLERMTRLSRAPHVSFSATPMAIFALRAPPITSVLSSCQNSATDSACRLWKRAALPCGLRAPPASPYYPA